MTNIELQNELKKYPDDMDVYMGVGWSKVETIDIREDNKGTQQYSFIVMDAKLK